MRRDERGIAVPSEHNPIPWKIIADELGGIASSNGEVFGGSGWDEDDEFTTHAANYHARLAEIARRIEPVTKINAAEWTLAERLHIATIANDAAALWQEMSDDK